MNKKIFGMAAISALAFGLFACSGEDGADGINGKDGAEGVSCTVKALKDDSGFKVLCDGDSVGVLKNGTDGKAGADGKAGKDGKDGADGEDGADGSGSVGKDGNPGANGEDGTSCTVKAVKDGFTVICGEETVGTVKNGVAGEPGEDCSLDEGENGVVTIQCGEKKVNLFKALCSDKLTPYDPETQVCGYAWIPEEEAYGYLAVPRCKDQSILGYTGDESNSFYDPAKYFCDNDVLVEKCYLKDNDGNDSLVAYDYENEWCDNEGDHNTISLKVPCGDDADGKKFKRKPSEYCYRLAGDPATTMRTADSVTCGSGNGLKRYSPVTHFCAHSNGTLRTRSICAKNASSADQYNLDIRYNSIEHLESHEGEMCDSREWQIYKTKTIGGITWMAEDLRYRDTTKTIAFDSSSFCWQNDCTQKNGVRLYFWSAVIDSFALANVKEPAVPKYCGYSSSTDYVKCTFDGPVQGVCPDGWHVPSEEVFPEEFRGSGDVYANIQSNGSISFGTYVANTKHWWSSRDYTNGSAYYFRFGSAGEAAYQPESKKMALAVRCVKDAEEVTP